MTFCSSRMLPGQLHRFSAFITASENGRNRPSQPPRALPGEVLRQRGNVLDPLAQRRDRDRKDVEAIVQIAPERSVLDHVLEIAVRGGHDPHVDALGPRAAEAFELALLQHAQQLGLHFHRDVADLVEEQRAAVRQLESARPARRRARERAASRVRTARSRTGSTAARPRSCARTSARAAG